MGRRTRALGLLLLCCFGAQAAGQDAGAPVETEAPADQRSLELRVVSLTSAGGLVVDRGSRDGVALGDRIWLSPKGAPPREGRVVVVREREAEVELAGSGGVPEPGTKGLVWLQVVAEAPPVAPEEPAAEATGDASEAPAAPATPPRPRWARPDDGWDAGQPLLARVHAERPGDRPRVIGGRLYAAAGGALTADGERGHGYLRSGVDAYVENLLGRGGRLDFDAELDLRSSFVPAPDGQDDGHGRVRFDELSYTIGGTRFAPEGHQMGRFLLRSTPEFGRLDGYEWTRRLESGDTLGASLGYLVEDSFDAGTGHDLAFSGFYRWIVDQRELVSVTGAVQKSFHNGARDRDRLLLKSDAAPDAGLGPWSLHSSLTYDLYSSADDLESGGGEFSRAWLQGWRDFESQVPGQRDSLSLGYHHEGYVQTLTDELPPLFAAGLVAQKSDRLSASGDFWMSTERRFFYSAGLWQDDQESGVDLEAGLALVDLPAIGSLAAGGHGDLRIFASNGRSSSTWGFGASYGRRFADESDLGWDLSFEWLINDRLGFTSAVDTSTQERLRYLMDLGNLGAWRLAGHADLVSGSSDLGLTTGFFLTRSF